MTESDAFGAAETARYLNTPWKVETFDCVPSVMDISRKRAIKGVTFCAAIAASQTKGRGRNNRVFFSPSGSGLYMSAVLGGSFEPKTCGRITAFAAVATARAIERLCDLKVDIKWVNDLYFGEKKLCGILTESALLSAGGAFEYVCVGIGVNLKKSDFPTELKSVVTDLESAGGKTVGRCRLAAEILNELFFAEFEVKNAAFMDEYRARSCVIGKTVAVNSEYEAKVVGIDDDCALILERDDKTIKFSAGEVSLKL